MRPDRVGVIPYFVRRGKLWIVVVCSLDGDRWVLPKGRPKKSLSLRDLAALEAWEEAGVRGRYILRRRIDVPFHQKGTELTLRLFPMRVDQIKRRWPERRLRRRRVVQARVARKLLRDSGLSKTIRVLEEMLDRR